MMLLPYIREPATGSLIPSQLHINNHILKNLGYFRLLCEVWTISSPFIFIEGAGHLNLLLRGLNPSGSLWTFLGCIQGLAADCLSVSSNSPSFVNTLTSKGHRLKNNVYGWCCNKSNNETNCSGEKTGNHKNPKPPHV